MSDIKKKTKKQYITTCISIMDEIYGHVNENLKIRNCRFETFYNTLKSKINLYNNVIELIWLNNFKLLFLELKESKSEYTDLFPTIANKNKWNTDKHKNGEIYLEKTLNTHYNKEEALLIIDFLNDNIPDIRNKWRQKEIDDNNWWIGAKIFGTVTTGILGWNYLY